MGYISYDSVRYWERLPSIAKDDPSVPDMEFGIYTDGIAFDHVNGEVRYCSLGEDRSEQVQRLLRGARRHRRRDALRPAPREHHGDPGLERIRFTSPHPRGFRRSLAEAFGRLPKLGEHVHLPVQSGSDRILQGHEDGPSRGPGTWRS